MQNMFVFAIVSERSQKTTLSTAFRKSFTDSAIVGLQVLKCFHAVTWALVF